jgi:hypothetical protein
VQPLDFGILDREQAVGVLLAEVLLGCLGQPGDSLSSNMFPSSTHPKKRFVPTGPIRAVVEDNASRI